MKAKNEFLKVADQINKKDDWKDEKNNKKLKNYMIM